MSIPVTRVASSSNPASSRLGLVPYLVCGPVALALMWSAVSGLINLESHIREFSLGFGAPAAPLAVIGASVLPIVELGLGMAWFLVFPGSRWIVECAALGVLAASIAGLLLRLRLLGALPECNCPSLLLARRTNLHATAHSLGVDGALASVMCVMLAARLVLSTLSRSSHPLREAPV